MSYCTNCGKEIPEGSKFCKYCGTPITVAPAATQAPPMYQQPPPPMPSPYAPAPPGFPVPPGFPTPAPKRPTGVTVIAILEFISGIIAIPTGLLFLGVSIFSILSIILGAADLVIGWGLWKLKKWGWMAAIAGGILGIILSLLSFDLWTILLNVVISGVIIYYLTRPHIKVVFQ